MRLVVFLAATCILLLLIVLSARAQDIVTADSLVEAEQWEEAAGVLVGLLEAEPEQGALWVRLGRARYMQQEYVEAAAAWEQAAELGAQPARSYYNAASAYARADRIDPALTLLERAAEAGFRQISHLEADPDFEDVRGSDRYHGVRNAVDRNAYPCRYDERFREFDFWVGDWEVYSQEEELVGTNRVDLLLNECLLQENWEGRRGGLGKSFNYFDPEAGRWMQVWVNAQGGHTVYTGGFSEGAMRFEGSSVAEDGTVSLSRMTFTPLRDGRVRQRIRTSSDGGQTWTTGFDAYYVPAEVQ